MVMIILAVGFFVIVWETFFLPIILPLFFTTYLLYGFVRPKISRQLRHDIEDEDEDETTDTLA